MSFKPYMDPSKNNSNTNNMQPQQSLMTVQPPSMIGRSSNNPHAAVQSFGTNSGSLHRTLLPNIDASRLNYNVYNNLQQQLISTNRNQKGTNPVDVHNKNHNHNHKTNSSIAVENKQMLRQDVERLKNTIRRIVETRYNLRENQHAAYDASCETLYTIYTQQYLKHDDEKGTKAAHEQLKQENIHCAVPKASSMSDGDILIKSNKSLAEITILGQTLYLLAMYQLEKREVAIAHKYIIRALMYWRCGNQCVKRMGATVHPKSDSNKSLLNEIFATKRVTNKSFAACTNLDCDDLGYFWPQLVQCYIMAGNVFLKHFEYDVSDLMYRTALELCHCMEGRSHFACLDPLEYLMTQMIVTHDIASAIVYCEEIIRILSTQSLVRNAYKLINTRALYSCLLRLSSHKDDQEYGYKLKAQCIKECMDKFGAASDHMFSLYLYFIKHCIQHGAEYMDVPTNFLEADQMIQFLSQQRRLNVNEEYHLCQVFEEYLFVISEQAITKYGINATKKYCAPHQEQSKHHHIDRLNRLHQLHMKHIDLLNSNPLSKQYNRNCLIDKRKIQSIYADTFEAYQDVARANQLRLALK
eukprot:36515_1